MRAACTDSVLFSSNGWGASAVDALSTAIVMEEGAIVETILDFISTIDFTKTSTGSVSLFETTIRYLGGMISGYDLLKGPFAHLAYKNDKIDGLIVQSIRLAETLRFAFNTPTGIPYNALFISDQTPANDGLHNGLATIGSLVLEWTRLSDITGNTLYTNLTQKAESYLLDPQPHGAQPFPGLLVSNVNTNTGLFINGSVNWGSGSDSFYEYLIKMFVYDPIRFYRYRDRWISAAESAMAHLALHPYTKPNITYLASFEDNYVNTGSTHLDCFAGGNFILGGLVLRTQRYIEFGISLIEGCQNLYKSTVTGLSPDSFIWDGPSVSAEQQQFWEEHGFKISDAAYSLRPEHLESLYYAYRVTGDRKYQDWSWEIFKAINATTRTYTGFSMISDVNNPGSFRKGDTQDSYFLAETLKYAYIIHSAVRLYELISMIV